MNDIDGITLAMHVGDSWWADEFKALFGGTAPAYQEFEGSFDKDTSTFTLTKGINFDGGYEGDGSRSRNFFHDHRLARFHV